MELANGFSSTDLTGKTGIEFES